MPRPEIEGIELAAACKVGRSAEVFGNATYMHGRVTNFNGGAVQRTYLTRLMPLTAQIGFRVEPRNGRFWAETVVVHAEDADKLSFSDQRDTSRVPPGGTPSYTVWHFRSGFQISDDTSLTLLLENITDVDYRIHGSGLNRPGRNFILGFATTF